MKRLWIRFLAVSLIVGLSAFANCYAEQHVLTQVSTIDALMTGVYDGETTLASLRQRGDFGIGTFNTLNGEMVFLDGHIYRIRETGKIEEPAPSEKTPFAAVTFFEPDKTLSLRADLDFQRFTAEIDRLLPTANIFYAIKITGVFQRVRARSVPAQTKPYRPLAEVVKTQSIFNFENIRGTIVGFRCPTYVKGVNVPGYHLHFISSDHSSGGHVLDFTIKEATVEIDYMDRFYLILPSDKGFYGADLTPDREKALKAVEK